MYGSLADNSADHLSLLAAFLLRLRPLEGVLASPASTSRRMASERNGRSTCRNAHLSTASVSAGGIRRLIMGAFPVAGRPAPGRLPPCFWGIAFFISMHYLIQACKASGPPGCVNTRNGPNPNPGVTRGSSYRTQYHNITIPLSRLFTDPVVRKAFERAERDNPPLPVEPDRPLVLVGGAAAAREFEFA